MTAAAGVALAAALAAAPLGDPLASLRRTAGKTRIEASGTLETVMLLAGLAAPPADPTAFQSGALARFSLAAHHPAVRETAALLERGLGWPELARLASFMAPAPHFLMPPSEELTELAALLPGGHVGFNLDRLHGYTKLVREFYWDNHVGRYLAGVREHYAEALARPLPADVPAGAKVLVSPLAPSGRLQFTRRRPSPLTYIVLGG